MRTFSPTWRLGAILVLIASGCAEDQTGIVLELSDVRAVYEKTVFDGAAATFDHEAIPGMMDAMRMDLPLADSAVATLAGLAPGAKVRISLMTKPRLEVLAIEALPDTTTLRLADR